MIISRLPLLDLGPGVAQRHGAVEDWLSGCGIGIDAEVAQAFELIAAARRAASREAGLQFAAGQHFERIRIQVGGEILALFGLVGILAR